MRNKKAQRITKTKADLEKELVDQVSFLVADCQNYDHGLIAAGKRIALSLWSLLHHTEKGPSKARLEQFGLRARRFYNAAGRIRKTNLVLSHSLVGNMRS